MNMEPKLLYLFNEPEISNPFEVEILLLHINMQLEVINSIKHFLDFLRSFDAHLVHNMMARLCVLWETYWDVGMQFGFTFKHDIKIVIPLVMVCINWLNLIINASTITPIDVVKLNLEKNMFDGRALIKKSSSSLVTKELSLFRRLSIP